MIHGYSTDETIFSAATPGERLVPVTFGQGYIISTIAGGGPPNGVPATTIGLTYVQSVAVDGSGNLYFVGPLHQNQVFKVTTTAF
jgi:hypothetical protein